MKKIAREFKGYVTETWEDAGGLIIGPREYEATKKDDLIEMLYYSVLFWIEKAFDKIYVVKDMKRSKKAHIRITIKRLD